MQRISTLNMSVGGLMGHADTIASNARASEEFMTGIVEYETGPDDLDALDDALESLKGHSTTFDDLKLQRDRVSTELQEREDAFRRGLFMKAGKHARYVFRDDAEAQDHLRLTEGVDHLRPSYMEWRRHAVAFVTRLQEDLSLRSRFLTGPFTREDLDTLSREMNDLEALYETREQLSADRQDARRARDAARAVVEKCLSAVQDLAEVIHIDHPEKLEAFGVRVPSTT